MTDNGRLFAIARLTDAPDLEALERVWNNLGREPQTDQLVVEHKNRLKLGFMKAARQAPPPKNGAQYQ